MKHSIVSSLDVESVNNFRIDAHYWQDTFIQNSNLVSPNKKLRDYVSDNIANIKSSPINRDFEYLEISKIFLNICEYETTKVQLGKEPDRAHYRLTKGDVVVSTVRPNRNAVTLINADGIIGSSGLAVLRPHNIEPEYLFAFCKTSYFINCLVRASKASMYPAVTSDDVLDTSLFFPSKSFQFSIVEIVKDSILALNRAKQIYTQAQSTLLTEIGLVNYKPKHKLTFIRDISVDQCFQRIDAGYFQPKYDEMIKTISKKSKDKDWDILENLVTLEKSIEVGKEMYLANGIPFVRVSNLTPFEITEEKYISEKLYAEIQKHQPRQGEILLSKDGSPGIAHYLHKEPEKMIPSSGILRLKNKTDRVNNEYLTLVLNSIATQEQINRDVSGSVIFHWRPDQVSKTVIPILNEEKQSEIQEKVFECLNLRKHAKELLKYAILAIEKAIEQGEQEAMNYLKSVVGMPFKGS